MEGHTLILMDSNPFAPLMDAKYIWGADIYDLDELRKNKRRVAQDLMHIFAGSGKPSTLWGPVGARKTRTVQALAGIKDANGVPYQVITVQPSTEDATIIHGIRYTKLNADGETTMERSIPDIAKQVVEYHQRTGGYTVMFLDEMTTCQPSQQHALLGFMTHGKFGEYDISPYTVIIMAANPPGTVMTVNDLDIQVMNRGAHIEWYGDVDIFLDEWSSGFGSPDREPDPYTRWFTQSLLESDRNHAFRSREGNWKPGSLVPQELIEHSERTTTDMSDVVANIQVLFQKNPVARKFYTIEVVRAFQGNKWAEKAAIVLQNEEETISYRDTIDKVREKEVIPTMDEAQVKDLMGDSLYLDSADQTLRSDQIAELAEQLAGRVERTAAGDLDRDALLALWVMISTAPEERIPMTLQSFLVRAIVASNKAYSRGKVEKEYLSPAFGSPEVKARIRASLSRG